MANEEHLAILRQGAGMWNRWRREHPDVLPDLSQANLHEADLSQADLSQANLSRAHLYEADLTGARLIEANLAEANLTEANLTEADLTEADLHGACLTEANLSRANLTEADLGRAKLSGANLSRADISGATLDRTIFATIDLSTVTGLDTVRHQGPSTIGIDTFDFEDDLAMPADLTPRPHQLPLPLPRSDLASTGAAADVVGRVRAFRVDDDRQLWVRRWGRYAPLRLDEFAQVRGYVVQARGAIIPTRVVCTGGAGQLQRVVFALDHIASCDYHTRVSAGVLDAFLQYTCERAGLTVRSGGPRGSGWIATRPDGPA